MTDAATTKGYDTCGGTTRRGTSCGRPAGWGTDHPGFGTCKLHLGCTPAHGVHAGRLQLAKRLGELLDAELPDRDGIDPHEELLEVIRRSAAWCRVLDGLVAELNPGRHIGGADDDREGLFGPDHTGDAKPHVLVGLLAEWSDRHAKNCKMAIEAGIEERRIRMAEGQAEIVAAIVRAVGAGVLELLGRLAVAGEVLAQVEAALPGVMRGALEAGRAGVVDVNEAKGA